MPTLPALTLALMFSPAVSASMGLDPARPPLHAGGGAYVFDDVVLQVLPGVVLHIAEGTPPPEAARHLGGRSWLLAVPDEDAAVDAAMRLDARAGVTAFPDIELPLVGQDLAFDDPGHGGQWYLEALGMQPLYERSLGDEHSRIAVLDSGIDIAHPDLAPAVDDPFDAVSDDLDPSPNPGEYCPNGGDQICDNHGTAVSGVVAARANNAEGIVGLCPGCTLVPVKLLGETRTGSLSESLRAFEHAIAADAGVINNSWGFTTSIAVPEPLAEVIARAHAEPRGGLGALVVFAAGNDNREIEADELQAMSEVLCVSATDAYGRYTNYTNSGRAIDVSAPSATVTLAAGGGVTTTFGGTSAAAPVVAGLAGWALSLRPDLSAAELQSLLIGTAVPSPLVTHDEDGHHPIYGYGQIDPRALWEALEPSWRRDQEAGGRDPPPSGGCATAPTKNCSIIAILFALGMLMARRRMRGWTISAHRVKVG